MITSVFLFVSLVEGVPSVIKVLCKITGKQRHILINYIYYSVYVVTEFAIHIYIWCWTQLCKFLPSVRLLL